MTSKRRSFISLIFIINDIKPKTAQFLFAQNVTLIDIPYMYINIKTPGPHPY